KVVTAKKTMKYMSISLAVVVLGLMLGYLFFGLEHVPGKTLNAVLFERIVADWGGGFGKWFVAVTLFSEALLLFAAAQSGFFGGPRVLANMARDRWFPSQFAILSERFVTHNGIILMGSAALLVMVLSKGSVKFLVILYSINVFIDFFLSQLGMVFYWWGQRKTNDRWKRKIAVVATGFTLTSFILFSVVILKFKDGGWMTILITGFLIVIAILIKRHYMTTAKQLRRLSSLIDTIDITQLNEVKNNPDKKDLAAVKYNAKYKTAVIFVNGYNGLGLHTLFNVIRLFEDTFRNFFFIQVGILNAGNFKGPEELDRLELTVKSDLDRYVQFMRSQGFYAEGFSGIGTDPVEHMCNIAYKIYDRHPNSVFFGGQMVFEKETFLTRMLYNYTTFTIQRKLYQHGIPFLIMPIRVE
ncbi:MAG TPA: amino acid permease, partial [Candidatus Omnitrophota bacterium]|nr:amino acid permease [Candidatus Omnitrophota bacterium]